MIDYETKEVVLRPAYGNEVRYSFSEWEQINNETIPELISRTRKEADTLAEAISKNSLQENTVLYRGAGDTARTFEKLGVTNDDLTSIEKLREKIVGKVYTEKGFMSVAPSSEKGFTKKINFIIECEEGTPLADFYEWNSGEGEILLNKGQKFDIKSVEEIDGKFYVHMRTIGK